jgi:ribonuclease Z
MDNLKIIYISHLHADHHLGLFSFLKLKKLKVIAPKQILNWLESYSRDFDQFDFELCPAGDFLDSKTVDDLEIQTCYVKHCPNAFGVSITYKNEKITYSGDTLPCEELVKLGLNSNLLIHEATMEDGMEAEAFGKMHSTFSQAVQIGKDMKAHFTILTHFSQRYSKVPWIDENMNLENVGLAFDNMRISMGQLPRLKGLGRLCSEVWKEDVEEMEGRRRRKMLKKSLL